MHTIRLNINDTIYDKLIWLLQRFDKSELEIIKEDANYAANKKYLDKELNDIDTGKAKFVSLDELNNSIDKAIKKYEN